LFASTAIKEETNQDTWHLIFPPSFTTKKIYKLGMVNGILTNQNGDPIQLISSHTYSMIDTSCNGKGDFDRKYCFCFDGYAGDECTTCAFGFKNVDTNGLNCVKQTGKLCLENSCGCQPNTSPCVPIGICDDSKGQINCTCPRNYGGLTCNQCATGYTNYNKGCIKVNNGCPNCTHGYCDLNLQACVCNDHFSGRTCDECANGWSGNDCSQEVPTTSSGEIGAVQSVALTAITVACIIIAILVLVGTIGLLMYKKFFSPRKYSQLELSEMEEWGFCCLQ